MTREIAVPPERLGRWLDTFAERHGQLSVTREETTVVALAPDGAEARITIPAPPLPSTPDVLAALVAHACTGRLVGGLLVRKGGYAMGVFAGSELVASKVGSSYVQARTKAGGWSQQRYARRRDQQARTAYAAAADAAAAVLLPRAGELVAVQRGGDRAGLAAVLADPRLEPLLPLLSDRVWPVAEPRLRVLREFGEQLRAVTVRLNDRA